MLLVEAASGVSLATSRTPSLSDLWQCLWRGEDGECPLATEPLRVLGLSVGALWALLVIAAVWDAHYLGGVRRLEGAQLRDVGLMQRSVRAVQRSQRRLASTGERAQAQLRRGQESTALVQALRAAVASGKDQLLAPLAADRLDPDDQHHAAPLWHTGD